MVSSAYYPIPVAFVKHVFEMNRKTQKNVHRHCTPKRPTLPSTRWILFPSLITSGSVVKHKLRRIKQRPEHILRRALAHRVRSVERGSRDPQFLLGRLATQCRQVEFGHDLGRWLVAFGEFARAAVGIAQLRLQRL